MSDALGVPILEMAARLMQAEAIPLRQDKPVDPLEWISWDADLIYRHAMSRAGKPVEPSRAPRHIYPISFMRDPVPALIHALLHSRLGPRRFF